MAEKEKKGKYQNRQSYLDAGIALIARSGVEKLTMRKLAEHLGVSPMAVYKHFSSKEELTRALLDEFIARADVLPDEELVWDEWMAELAGRMYAALSEEPSWLPMLGGISVGPAAMQVTASFLQKLTTAGFAFEEALEAYLAMIHVIVGAASIQASFRQHVDEQKSNLELITGQQQSGPADGLMGFVTGSQLAVALPLVIDSLKVRLESRQ